MLGFLGPSHCVYPFPLFATCVLMPGPGPGLLYKDAILSNSFNRSRVSCQITLGLIQGVGLQTGGQDTRKPSDIN